MKALTIVRHAKSSWDHLGVSDHDRPLNPRGEQDAPRMAEYLLSTQFGATHLISSSAKRAQQTAQSFQRIHQLSNDKLITEPELYHAGMQEWITVIERYWPMIEREEAVVFFAHNPGITNVVNWLCAEDIFNIPTCGMAILQFPDDIHRIDSGVATLVDYQIPKKL